MRIEIDQSGKLENTQIDTVVAFSNHIKKSIIISAKEKKKLQKYFRSIGKPRLYTYKTFSVLIFLLIKPYLNRISQITIDTEYVGWSHQIKDYLLVEVLKCRDFDKRAISFHSIGRKSNAHYIAHSTFKKENKPNIVASVSNISKYI